MIFQSRARKVIASRGGFTLIELILVIVILSLIAGATAFSVRGHLSQARSQLAIDQLILADRQLRDSAARTKRPMTLTFDLSRRSLVRGEAGELGSRLESDLRVSRVRCGGQDVERGGITVRFTVDGSSPTYAVRLEDSAKRPTWLLFAGMTGQPLLTQDEQEVEALFRW